MTRHRYITQDTINRLKPWLTIEDDRAIGE
jgi:hypothetical protein